MRHTSWDLAAAFCSLPGLEKANALGLRSVKVMSTTKKPSLWQRAHTSRLLLFLLGFAMRLMYLLFHVCAMSDTECAAQLFEADSHLSGFNVSWKFFDKSHLLLIDMNRLHGGGAASIDPDALSGLADYPRLPSLPRVVRAGRRANLAALELSLS